MKLYCATGNPGKLREFGLAGHVLNIDVEPLPGLKTLEAPEETGDTFEANAILKAEYYSQFADGPLFADDSGLAVDALGGAPGVLSARYAETGLSGHDADEANNQLVLKNLARLADTNPDRTARFVCVIALADKGKLIQTFRGEVVGELLHEAKGPGGFGYDPLFYYPPFGCTFGEAASERKFDVSHRGNALRQMLQYLTR